MLQSQSDDNSMDKSLSFLPCSQYRIVDFCNGLLLCHSVEGTLHTCYVCNPATKRWTELPMPDYHLILLALCFNPSISLNYTVIGLKVESSGDMTNTTPGLFSSKNLRWPVEKNVPRRCGMNSYITQQVLLNGSTHYLTCTKPFAWGIDLEREIYRKIKLPVSEQEVNYGNACLGQSQGYLHYAQKFDDRMVVWVLHDYDETKWGLKNTIHLKNLSEKQEVSVAPLSSNNFPSMACLDLLVFHPDFDVLFIRIDGKIFSYHLVSSNLTEIVIPLKKTGRFYPYRPCLVEDSLKIMLTSDGF